MTYAVLATNPQRQELGIALCTITLNASRITPLHHGLLPEWNDNGLIVTAQATANPMNAYRMFELWDKGWTFDAIEDELAKSDEFFSWRQIGAVSAGGEIYGYTGDDAFDHKSHIIGDGSIAIGNFCDGPSPVAAMAEVLDDCRDEPMAERLLNALEAGRDAGGQFDPQRGHVPEVFATLLVFDGKQPWPAVDLRVEFDMHAVAKLRRLYEQARRLDPMLAAMYRDPKSTFDEYHVVYDIVDSQV
ncbi:MAG: putative Ntn-hydrolase superfamily protein [Gammaproteobacteria bacterium]|jgi:uncharacterized Ntn-hydrolase superfamily protein